MHTHPLAQFTCPRWDALPDLALYMDQVMLVMGPVLAPLTLAGEKPITSTMVNNYVKHKLVPPPVKKKYQRPQLARLLVVSILKRVLSMEEIAALLGALMDSLGPQAAYDLFAQRLEAAVQGAFGRGEVRAEITGNRAGDALSAALAALAAKLLVEALMAAPPPRAEGAMATLHSFDAADYERDWTPFVRLAVRAVIVAEGKLALVKSAAQGYYKFPGGGIEPGESHEAALIRETLEETGLQLAETSIRPLGLVEEIRKGTGEKEIFRQTSYYYRADIREGQSPLRLDDYEARLGYHPEWVDAPAAYAANTALYEQGGADFLRREAFVLKHLIDSGGV